jgi:hypothetical protein
MNKKLVNILVTIVILIGLILAANYFMSTVNVIEFVQKMHGG